MSFLSNLSSKPSKELAILKSKMAPKPEVAAISSQLRSV